MIKKSLFLCASLALAAMSAHAYDIIVKSTDGKTLRVPTDNIEEVIFDEEALPLSFSGIYDNNLTFNSGAADIKVEFTAPMYWIVSQQPSQTWLRVNETFGREGKNALSISVDSNDGNANRTATFAILCGFKPVTFNVTQYTIEASSDVSLPDPAFREFILANYDSDGNGKLSQAEAKAITSLDVANKGITTLEGVRAMTNLRTLVCDNNLIEGELNLSGLKNLTDLTCGYNRYSKLNLAGCSGLVNLRANDNYTSSAGVNTFYMTAIDLTGCSAVKYINLQDNTLSAINLSDCAALEDLHLEINNIKSIDLTHCQKLIWAHIRNNNLGGGSVDFTKCPNIQGIFASDMQLGAINIAGCSKLKEISVQNNRLQKLDLAGCNAIERLECLGNSIDALNVTACANLKTLWASFNKLQALDITKCPQLTMLSVGWNQIAGTLDLRSNSKLTELSVQSNQLTSLSTTRMASLTKLDVGTNQLTTLDLSVMPMVQQATCSDNALTSIDLTGASNLRILKLNQNKLTHIDLAGAPNIVSLEIENNYLTDIDLTKTPTLGEVFLKNNELTEINMRGLSNLGVAEIYDNHLTKLDLTGCVNLYELHFQNNSINYFSPKAAPSLKYVDCRNNGIKRGIDFSSNELLQTAFGTENPECAQVYLSELAPNGTIEFDPTCKVNLGYPTDDFLEVGGGNWGDGDIDPWN